MFNDMKSGYLKFVVVFLIVVQFWFTTQANVEIEEDNWMNPDAWARDHLSFNVLQISGKCCKCSEDLSQSDHSEETTNEKRQFLEDAASIIYFKKFITMMFNRKHLKYDSTLQTYERSIVFTLQPSQLDKLEQLQDPRDLDNILTEIFNNVRTPNMYRDCRNQVHTTEASSGFKAIVFEILYDMWQLTKISEIRFLSVVVLVLLIAWILNTRFNISWLFLIFGGIFIYGYLHSYLECNRELEVNQMLEILNRDKSSKKIAQDSKIVKFLKGIFSNDESKDLENQKLRQSAKLSLDFCRPDHVLIKYFNDIFLTYLQVLLEQCTVTLTKLNGTLGFPYNILSGCFLVCLIGYIIKLTFKYILNPSIWVHLIHRKTSISPRSAAITNISNSHDDRISGDNLKLLLSAISGIPQRNGDQPTQSSVAAVSGVEEVKETIEAPPKQFSPQLDKNTAVRKQNNNSIEKQLVKNTDVMLEDLHEDS